jgi:NTP pyrophosphatase (non-canonical NTP hydrolase)
MELDETIVDFNDYQLKALRTQNPDLSVRERLAQGALGLNTEAGEAGDVVKKFLYQGHKLDRQKLLSELGDVLWYVVTLAAAADITFKDIVFFNIGKLIKRYKGEGFSVENSVNRN